MWSVSFLLNSRFFAWNKMFFAMWWWLKPFLQVHKRCMQVNLPEFETSLVCWMSSRMARAHRGTQSQNKTTTTTKCFRWHLYHFLVSFIQFHYLSQVLPTYGLDSYDNILTDRVLLLFNSTFPLCLISEPNLFLVIPSPETFQYSLARMGNNQSVFWQHQKAL